MGKIVEVPAPLRRRLILTVLLGLSLIHILPAAISSYTDDLRFFLQVIVIKVIAPRDEAASPIHSQRSVSYTHLPVPDRGYPCLNRSPNTTRKRFPDSLLRFHTSEAWSLYRYVQTLLPPSWAALFAIVPKGFPHGPQTGKGAAPGSRC